MHSVAQPVRNIGIAVFAGIAGFAHLRQFFFIFIKNVILNSLEANLKSNLLILMIKHTFDLKVMFFCKFPQFFFKTDKKLSLAV